MKFVPLNGSPPIPMTIDWPSPCTVVMHGSYVKVPDRETTPILVFVNVARPMPILLSPALMMPGQFGPMRSRWSSSACPSP